MKATPRDTFWLFGVLLIPYTMYEWFGVAGALLAVAFLAASIRRA